jgi:hypothetical protein
MQGILEVPPAPGAGSPQGLSPPTPWMAAYSFEYVLARTRFLGPIDFAHIYQVASSGNATADGLADALDVGLAI